MDLHEISVSLQSGRIKETLNLIARAVKENHNVGSILKEGLADGMAAVEQKLKDKEIYLPDMLVTATVMNKGIEILRPALESIENPVLGTAITGTLKGDIQNINKNLIAALMRSEGLKVIDLGVNVSNELFIDTAEKEKARVIVCSAYLTVHLPQMKALAQAAASMKARENIKLLFTGLPVTEQFCRSIGADIYAPDVVSAAETAAAYCKRLKKDPL
ncbi:MAG: cobalamin-dependent protein [Treponema sp.]|jgi:methanogenic corrinoid protein MtbC1|nr:cobalamin-dependent protein [Treponema sp.]